MAVSFPFSAIVGQDEMKTAALIAAVEPSIGGVLVLGDRGTGKSTAIRALASLLPPVRVVAGCPFRCDPDGGLVCESCSRTIAASEIETRPVEVVDLPLGATEDRIVGALDLERALTRGEKVLSPGLLARANRGFLYIDEVNLLEDHLVDVLLDVAASGVNVIEREGLSVRHPARFVLVGSGNPEEGELRPQLLDRFGLAVEVSTPQDIETRVEIVRRRDRFERDPAGFAEQWEPAESALREQIVVARGRIAGLEPSTRVLEMAARLCTSVGTDGLRGELTLVKASRALAALEGDDTIELRHLRRVVPAALRHRLRRSPLDDTGSGVRIERALGELMPEGGVTLRAVS